MTIPRALHDRLLATLTDGKQGIVLYGARQVGKTTLINDILKTAGLKTLTVNADTRGSWWDDLVSRDLERIGGLISGYDAVFVDEAQRIPEIGIILKIIRDEFPNVRLIATGSSSLDLASRVSEPLTGRVYTYKLYPIAQQELRVFQTPYERLVALSDRLIFGSYPRVFSLEGNEARREYLQHLVSGYLYKDLLEFGGIRNSAKIYDLLKLLAYQVGSQVSLTELSKSLELGKSTVDRYIDLLEKSYVIFRLQGFSRNLRKEVTKMHKIFFYDNGIRNSLIENWNNLDNRADVGQLWENFLISERKKRMEYNGSFSSHFFWRLQTGAELDLVEETGGKLHGFEFKFSSKTPRVPISWHAAYPTSTYAVVNRETWKDFV